jgi:hypothetical protein
MLHRTVRRVRAKKSEKKNESNEPEAVGNVARVVLRKTGKCFTELTVCDEFLACRVLCEVRIAKNLKNTNHAEMAGLVRVRKKRDRNREAETHLQRKVSEKRSERKNFFGLWGCDFSSLGLDGIFIFYFSQSCEGCKAGNSLHIVPAALEVNNHRR